MNHPSPYELLRGLDQPERPFLPTDRAAPSVADLRAVAERWEGPQARPTAQAAASDPAVPPAAPAKGPALRTPPPMYPPTAFPTTAFPTTAFPPTAFPTGIASYNASAQPQRHAYYDAILEQHRNAAKRAVFVEQPLE